MNGLADALELGRLICFSITELMIPKLSPSKLLQLENQGDLILGIEAVVDAKSVFDA